MTLQGALTVPLWRIPRVMRCRDIGESMWKDTDPPLGVIHHHYLFLVYELEDMRDER
jgi:hypothetical protein